MSLLDLANRILGSNQDNHRLTSSPLKDLSLLNRDNRLAIESLCQSNDKAQVCLGVLIWAILSTNKAIFVFSQNDLQELVDRASALSVTEKFKVSSTRSKMTIYGQLTGLMVSKGICKVLRASRQGSQTPAVIEVTESSLLSILDVQDINSTRLQVLNATRPQGNKTTILQDYNTTRQSELVNELANEQANELVDEYEAEQVTTSGMSIDELSKLELIKSRLSTLNCPAEIEKAIKEYNVSEVSLVNTALSSLSIAGKAVRGWNSLKYQPNK